MNNFQSLAKKETLIFEQWQAFAVQGGWFSKDPSKLFLKWYCKFSWSKVYITIRM